MQLDAVAIFGAGFITRSNPNREIVMTSNQIMLFILIKLQNLYTSMM